MDFALNIPLGGGHSVHALKVAISLVLSLFSQLIFAENPLHTIISHLSNWQVKSEHFLDFLIKNIYIICSKPLIKAPLWRIFANLCANA